jgi:hypothetical protein
MWRRQKSSSGIAIRKWWRALRAREAEGNRQIASTLSELVADEAL